MKFFSIFLAMLLITSNIYSGELKDIKDNLRTGYKVHSTDSTKLNIILNELKDKNWNIKDIIPLNESTILIFYSSF